VLNHESVAEPLGIGLNMLVDPFLCPWRQRAKQEHGSFITHQYIGRGFEFDFHVSFEGGRLARLFLLGFRARLLSGTVFMAMWKKIAIVVVAWVGSVLVYVEFFKAR
jgi:hypothetical protein